VSKYCEVLLLLLLLLSSTIRFNNSAVIVVNLLSYSFQLIFLQGKVQRRLGGEEEEGSG
jgi:hypothetical protein